MAFWQSCAIQGGVVMNYHYLLNYMLGWEKEEMALAMQNFLICTEMTFAAVLMFYAFSHKDFQDGRQHS